MDAAARQAEAGKIARQGSKKNTANGIDESKLRAESDNGSERDQWPREHNDAGRRVGRDYDQRCPPPIGKLLCPRANAARVDQFSEGRIAPQGSKGGDKSSQQSDIAAAIALAATLDGEPT